MRPILLQQEPPLDSPESNHSFQPSAEKPFVATAAAIEAYSQQTIIDCLKLLQQQAEMHDGIDCTQVLDDPAKPEMLLIIDDGSAITALLPSDN